MVLLRVAWGLGERAGGDRFGIYFIFICVIVFVRLIFFVGSFRLLGILEVFSGEFLRGL